MIIYIIKNGVCIETMSLINASRYEIGEEIKEILDKQGNVSILISNENVTDPIKELILGEKLVEI